MSTRNRKNCRPLSYFSTRLSERPPKSTASSHDSDSALLTHNLNKARTAYAKTCASNPPISAAMTDDFPPDSLPTNPLRLPKSLREIDSQELMQGEREIVIRHRDDAYRLSVTRSGKLILRK
jgi:hemin uptake protein HemP